jgi:eukaryotic-like serine/threonine-protein kinase
VIGSGGIGTVWAAVDEVLGRRVAVKDVVTPPWLSDEERTLLRERTLREAQAACRIDDPHVVTVYDVVEHDGRPWIIMQLVQARSLAEIIEDDGPCTPTHAAQIGLQVLSALQAAHGHGILHRDVKPSNVLVNDDWAVLTDFGIATIHGEAALTSPDTLVGAPSYIAPERVRGEPASPASDLWSLGATLYTAVEGRPPHLREGVLPILTAVATDEPDPPRHAGALAPVLAALLQKDPALRPSAVELEQELRRIVSGIGDTSTALVAVPPAAVPPTADDTQALPQAIPPAVPPVSASTASPPDERGRRQRRIFATAAALTVLALLLGGLLIKEVAVPGFPTRQQPAGEPATTVPVTTDQRAPQQTGANPVAPVDQDSSTTTPAQTGTTTSQDAQPAQPSTQPSGPPAPTTTTPAPTPSTTDQTTSVPPEPTPTTAATSVLP